MLEADAVRARLLVAVVVAILFAGLWPSESLWGNRARIDEGRGLLIGEHARAQSAQSLQIPPDRYTLEFWLQPLRPRAKGVNQEILSLQSRAWAEPLLLGEWPGGLLLRFGAENPRRQPRRDRYVERGLTGERMHVALVADSRGRRLFVDGEAFGRIDRPSTGDSAGALRGRLVLGSAERGWPAWRGHVEALAFHSRVLSAAELRAHSALSREMLRSHLRAGDASRFVSCDLLARQSPLGGPECPELRIPENLRPVHLRWLNGLERTGRRAHWLVGDLALNLLGFVPFGLLLGWRRSAFVVLAAGCALSLSIEGLQPFLPGRYSSLFDLGMNVAGTALGFVLALALHRLATDLHE